MKRLDESAARFKAKIEPGTLMRITIAGHSNFSRIPRLTIPGIKVWMHTKKEVNILKPEEERL